MKFVSCIDTYMSCLDFSALSFSRDSAKTYVFVEYHDWVFVSHNWVHSEYTLCPLATSTLVERAFSRSELFVRLHRARISDNLLSQFMLAGC